MSVDPIADMAEGAPPIYEGTALDALKTEWQEQARNQLLNEIDAWLLDEGVACDVDSAEWDAGFYRKVRQAIAGRFKPC